MSGMPGPIDDVRPRTLRLTLAYDGGGFHGWQRQPSVRTVQQEVEHAIASVLREPVAVVGASRTDAGVHAAGQVAHLRTSSTLPLERLRRAIGDRLPDDVTLVDLADAHPAFHATHDAIGKLYRYRIFNSPRRPCEAQSQRTHWHVWHPLDLDRMRQAGAYLVGTHDFSAFASSGSERSSTVRTVWSVEPTARFDEVRIDVAGDGFLYNQVRNMVGTLYEVGRGHWPPQRVAEILASRDRRTAGPTAPAHGLCLQWVKYPRPPRREDAASASSSPGTGHQD